MHLTRDTQNGYETVGHSSDLVELDSAQKRPTPTQEVKIMDENIIKYPHSLSSAFAVSVLFPSLSYRAETTGRCPDSNKLLCTKLKIHY